MRPLRLTALLLALLVVAGCAGPSKKSPLMKATPQGANFNLTAEQLRIQTRSLVDPFAGRIESTADEIIADSDDPRLRLAALEWKANSIPALREALFRPDPLAAVMDAWAFTKQMVDYFETGEGRERLGAWADFALSTSRDLDREFETFLAGTVNTGDISAGRQFIDRWAAEHPIHGSIAGRPSILNEVADVRIKGGLGGFKSLGRLSVSMDDLSRRMEVYSAQLPKIATWQAEIMLLGMLGDDATDPPLARLPELMDTAAELGATVEELPDLVAEEREAIFEEIRAERLDTLEYIRAEREAILAWATAEREAILRDVDRMRQATTDDLRGEVRTVTETLLGERDEVIAAADDISTRAIDHSMNRAESLIDHVFVRLIQLLGIALVGAVLLIVLARALLRPKAA
jgi:hypothetical protein